MKETIEFIRDTFNAGIDRLKIPLFNSLVISWAVFNWKPIFIMLFSEKSIEERIADMPAYTPWYNVYLFPPLIALFYVFVFPYVKRWIHNRLKKVNNDNRDNQYLFKIDAYSVKTTLAEKKRDYRLAKEGAKKVEELSAEIERLTLENEQIKNEKIEVEKSLAENRQQLTKELKHSEEIAIERDELSTVNLSLEKKLESAENDVEDMKAAGRDLAEAFNKERATSDFKLTQCQKEKERLKEEKNILLTERDLDRKIIKETRETLTEITKGYRSLVDYQLNKIRKLRNMVVSTEEKHDINNLIENSELKSEEFWDKYIKAINKTP